MKKRQTFLPAVCLLLVSTMLLAACESKTTPPPSPSPVSSPSPGVPGDFVPVEPTITPTFAPSPTGTLVDAVPVTQPPTPVENAPSPTPVTATSTGAEMTSLQALAVMKPKAVAWQSDALLGLLANTRPGQQKNLLGGTLGSLDVNEPTSGGRGRNWTLVAFSPSAQGAFAVSMDGTQVDLVKEGAVDADIVARFTGSGTAGTALSGLDPAKLVDSDEISRKAAQTKQEGDESIVLVSPEGLGMGPLPTPQSGGSSPQLAYELFAQSGEQRFMFFDAATGALVLDSAAP